MHQPPHNFSSAPPTFFHRDHDWDDRHHEFVNQSIGVIAYPVVIEPPYAPYAEDGFFDQPGNTPDNQPYGNLAGGAMQPGAPPVEGADAPGSYPSPPSYSSPAISPAAPAAAPAPAPSPEMQYVPGSADKVTLVFKDGRPPEEIQNYLATASTITVLEGHHHRLIRVSDLDLPATLKANQQTGVDFQLPGAAK